jgi:hypothetical protein
VFAGRNPETHSQSEIDELEAGDVASAAQAEHVLDPLLELYVALAQSKHTVALGREYFPAAHGAQYDNWNPEGFTGPRVQNLPASQATHVMPLADASKLSVLSSNVTVDPLLRVSKPILQVHHGLRTGEFAFAGHVSQ